MGETGRKYMVYYSERLHVESAVHACKLNEDGVIGRVLQVLGTGPHRLNAPSRPEWFFRIERYGGILCDIGNHQIEQFLRFSGAATSAKPRWLPRTAGERTSASTGSRHASTKMTVDTYSHAVVGDQTIAAETLVTLFYRRPATQDDEPAVN